MSESRPSALLPTQRAFVTSNEPFPAFVGGFGSGKTGAGIARAMMLKTKYRKQNVAYYLPTFSLVEDVAVPRFSELCERRGWAYHVRGGGTPHIAFPNAGKIIFRSMDRPERIIGYEVSHSIVDELDTMPIDKARTAWIKIIARNREKCGVRNTVGVVTTPEGFRFVYERWKKNPAKGYVLFHAHTEENAANLPEDYIQTLRDSYTPALLEAYLAGQFVNLTSGSVYLDFDRKKAHTSERMQPGEVLHVGMDFNVMNMTAVVSVIRNDKPITVAEATGVRDTPAMAALLLKRYNGHAIVVYPDASGSSRKSTNSQESDHSILKQANFTLKVNASNPAVRDRVNAVNKIIPDWKINTDECPVLVQSLEQQAYDKNGEPSKEGGHDHACDAAGYFITQRWPIVRRIATVSTLRI